MGTIFRRLSLTAVTITSAALLLSGCTGKDGATGANGTNGTNGTSASLTNESCIVCHNSNDVASVDIVHAFTTDPLNFNTRSKPRQNEKNFFVTIKTVESTPVTNLPKITFNVKVGTKPYPNVSGQNTPNGSNYTKLTKEYLSRIVIADLVPANTATAKNGTWGSDYFENWAYEAGTGTGANAVTFDATDAANGNYAVTLPKAWGTASSTNATVSDYNASHVQRVYVRVAAPADSATNATNHANFLLAFPNGNSDVLNFGAYGVGNAAGIKDIAGAPAIGAQATLLADARNVIVTAEACYKCHGPQLSGAGHGGGYQDTLACVLCHSPLAGTVIGQSFDTTVAAASRQTYNDFYFPRWIHGIHSAQKMVTGTRVEDFSNVTYPQDIASCTVCHTTSGRTLGLGNKTDNWKNNPTAEICGTCHTGANFVTGVGHAGGIKANGTCTSCHAAADIVAYHTPAPATKNVPEYDVTLAVSAPASGTFYVTGETPTVTVTLKNHADGTAVPGSLYTTAPHAAGTSVDGVLSKAVLYVYGPRTNAKPVLTTAAATLSATGVPTQAQKLFPSASDANITTSATGFSYKLKPITASMSGTYMVRFIAQNYGYVSDTDYKIDSVSPVTLLQINTATVDKKNSGDACTDCHGAGTLGVHNARHSVKFNTDECLSCHDNSGNYANPIGNRVHSIHSAQISGDMKGLNWKEVTYPQVEPTYVAFGTTSPTFTEYSTGRIRLQTSAPRCITCHTSGSTLYSTFAISKAACQGCHADKLGAIDHMKQMGGK